MVLQTRTLAASVHKIALPEKAKWSLLCNIVILPQAASELSRLLPLPASVIANEIVVIWVANQAEPLTADKIPKKLLTVRRDKMIAALRWLKKNNPLYSDVSIDGNALTTYPEGGHLPMPCFNSVASASTEAEGAGYVPPATAPSQSSDASQIRQQLS
ncbi:hypothetical protein L198_04039 [Cryptococcus wingfieldii CBS 7118]|uniref:DUF6570 domain-containing protein n=1 Tax=Cryptococcus wingfieldii CBS 7118 TaxID=1295528 RepID=A0A1E3J9F4_9TREE|nr:hypothetical protein L198_04039 [Cryptococcus wingfieldii CBS 7118]ODN97472.1 hypothetical protein L198_04039 [Cryptococcus wingfieldii CBS 7118]